MSDIIYGEVNATCPKCAEHVDIEGEFSESDPARCGHCETLLVIVAIQATYDVTLELDETETDESLP